MKRLLFSIISILQFAGMASSCKKCVTCTVYYYSNLPAYTDPKYCGNTQQIKAYEKGFTDLQNVLTGDSVKITCADAQ